MGSADYIAPEQARDAHAADSRADIYSLGCTLYYLLTSRPPFPDGTTPEKLQQHTADDPLRLGVLRPEAPRELAKIVAKMMAKRPEDRYQTAAEVAAALAPFAREAVPKRRAPRKIMLAVAGLALVMVSLAGVVRLPLGDDREIVIDTDDPHVEVVVKGDRIVRIVDPKSGKAYQLDRSDLTLSLADDEGGLSMTLGDRPVMLKRQGKRLATVWVEKKTNPAVRTDESLPLVQLDIRLVYVRREDARRLASGWMDVRKTNVATSGILKDRVAFFGDLNALAEKGLARLISEPRVVTRSGRPSWIVSGGETPIYTTTSGEGVPETMYKTYGTVINFLAVVLGNGKLRLDVEPEISIIKPGAGTTLPGANGATALLGFDVRSAKITVQLEDGQTLAIALPSPGKKHTEQEIIVLVMPQVVDVRNPPQDIRPSPYAPKRAPAISMSGHIAEPPTPPPQDVATEKKLKRAFDSTDNVGDPTEKQVQLDTLLARVKREDAQRLASGWMNVNKTPNAAFGVLKDRAGFLRELYGLIDKRKADLLSSPRMMTLSGRPALIHLGGGAGRIVVNSLPIIMGNGKIHLEVRPEISSINSAAGIPAPEDGGKKYVPGFDLRSAQVTVQMQDSQTVAITLPTTGAKAPRGVAPSVEGAAAANSSAGQRNRKETEAGVRQ